MMRNNSKTTNLFRSKTFQEHLKASYSIDEDGNLLGIRGKPIYGGDNGSGYRLITIVFEEKRFALLAHRLVFFLAHGRIPGEIDHIDHDKTNNNANNLREISHSANIGRRPKRKTTTSSPYKGVYKRRNRWPAQCAGHYIGTFNSEEEAARAYDAAALARFGLDACLNFPQSI